MWHLHHMPIERKRSSTWRSQHRDWWWRAIIVSIVPTSTASTVPSPDSITSSTIPASATVAATGVVAGRVLGGWWLRAGHVADRGHQGLADAGLAAVVDHHVPEREVRRGRALLTRGIHGYDVHQPGLQPGGILAIALRLGRKRLLL